MDVVPAPAMVMEGIGVHVEDIGQLVSMVLSLIISWIFGIVAHKRTNTGKFTKYKANFWSQALKRTNSQGA